MPTFQPPFNQPPAGPASAGGSVTLSLTLSRARVRLEAFLRLMSEVPYDNEGIPMSEMFFLLCAAGDEPPGRILESGRGGGQSTEMLGHAFPASNVISIEENDRSPNARAAVARLERFPGVDCRFGDSRRLLPGLVQSGDLVLIDGPKEFRALQLAFRLLRTGHPRAVFVHDLHVDSPARHFLDAHVPEAFYSDEPEFVERYAYLDTLHGARPKEHWIKANRRGYGPTLACIPGSVRTAAGYARLSRRLTLSRVVSHAKDKWNSLTGNRGA